MTSESESPAVRTDGVWKIFQQEAEEVQAVRNVSLTVERGEFTALAGPSGSGKTTLLNLIGGLTRPTRGQVWVAGQNVTEMSNQELAQLRLEQVGFVFQFHHLLPEFTAVENVAMPLRIARVPPGDAVPRAEALLHEVGLSERVAHRPGMLSGGEQQRVAVARALVMRPALLLADEPTGDLDAQTGEELHGLLRRMHTAHGLTSLIATHNLRLAESCDRVLRLEDGCLNPV